MKASLKKKWVEALESGRYEQTTGALLRHGVTKRYAYCALGVLDRVNNAKIKAAGVEFILVGNSESRELLPFLTRQRIIAMNDLEERNFKTIAAWIRKHVKTTRGKK